MMYGLLLAAIAASVPVATVPVVAMAPASQQTPNRLRIIVTVKSHPFCSAIKSMALPIGYVMRRNDDAFLSLISDAKQGAGLSGAAGPASYVAALEKKRAAGAPVRDRSSLTAGIYAHMTEQAIVGNLVTAENLMNASWQRYPRGTDPNVDGFRQRLQNLVDLQRALVNDFEQASTLYFRSIGSRPSHVSTLRGMEQGEMAAMLLEGTTSDPEDLPDVSAHDIARFGTSSDVQEQLALQQAAFAKEITVAGTTCGI